VRIDLPGKNKILSLAEVQLWDASGEQLKVAEATQSSTDHEGEAKRAIDGNTNGNFDLASTTHTRNESNPWWEVDLGSVQLVQRVVVWNRTDGNLQARLDGAHVQFLDVSRNIVFEQILVEAPRRSQELTVVKSQKVELVAALASYAQAGFPGSAVVDNDTASGWGVEGRVADSHLLTLIPKQPLILDEPSQLHIEIDHRSAHRHHLLGSFRVEFTTSQGVDDWALLDDELLDIHQTQPADRKPQDQQRLLVYYARHISKTTRTLREELSDLQEKIAALKPDTSVPIMRDRDSSMQRETRVQLRGNYKSLGDVVEPGVPAAFHPLEQRTGGEDRPPLTRLDLAHWLVDRRNPLTARVWVNRIWESLYGLGLVRSSEDFGSQGDMPSHPELLDWLACEFMDRGWDTKYLLKLLVTSQAYQQTSQVGEELLTQDLENVWLARGPRVRLSAEMVRDQALSLSGLLSTKMYGSPVRPPQPNMGLKAAFGSDTDWSTSQGADRYRRGLYTTWRRSNPYPSMATFDAPSREVCTLKRDSTNTPLQALVTLNDPAFVETAQGLARRLVLYPDAGDTASSAWGDEQRLQLAFRLCTSRSALPEEVSVLLELLNDARGRLSTDPESARQLATDPLGEVQPTVDLVDLAAWTSVCNVLLNLDEVLMKR
jgi:hypothetical protein